MLLYLLSVLLDRWYIRAYDEATHADIEYYASHRDEGFPAAHRNRDRVNRRFGR